MKKIVQMNIKDSYLFLVEDLVNEKVVLTKIKGVIWNSSYEKYVILDSKMNLISDAYTYLNYECIRQSPNTLEQKFMALKLFYCFIDLFSLDIYNLTINDRNKFLSFMAGIDSNTDKISIKYSKKRSQYTVNYFFNQIKTYMNYLNGIYKNISMKFCKNNDNYIPRAFNYIRTQTSPDYINLHQYRSIISYIDNLKIDYWKKLRNKLIIMLQYEGGLRLGEVLGLTVEDVKFITSSDKQEITVYLINIRNRLTDKKDQNAKTVPHIYNKDEYELYNNCNQQIIMTANFGDIMEEYIEIQSHKFSSKNIADTINNKSKLDKNNYLFLNDINTPISRVTWGEELKKIYEACGIPLDNEKKQKGLSHRFRHGYAMYLLEQNINIDQVKVLMRHKSINSTLQYTKPTLNEIIKIKLNIEQEINKEEVMLYE